MLSLQNIVLVDNDLRELDQLRDAFFSAGIPCLPLQYIADDPENISGLDHHSIPEHPRILFVDLNLADSQNLEAPNLVGHIVRVLEKVTKADTPYFLVFWSKLREQPAQVMDLLCERFSDYISMPFAWDFLSKAEYQTVVGQPATEKESIKRLATDLIAMLEDQPLFKAMISWESRVSNAAKQTFSTLYSLSRPNDEKYTIEGHNSKFKTLICRIAQEAIGKKNVHDYPACAVESGLFPVLADKLSTIENPEMHDALWLAGVPNLEESATLDQFVVAKLNGFYHVEEVRETHKKTDRGIFVELREEIRQQPPKQTKFERHIGKSIESIISEEFLNLEGQEKALKDVLISETRLGFVELSANCDHAQNKIKLYKYALCALIPLKNSMYTVWTNSNGLQRNTSHQGIYRTPPINIRGNDYIVKISYKYQVGCNNSNTWLGSPEFRFREQILSDIRSNCSQYSARTGIICFK